MLCQLQTQDPPQGPEGTDPQTEAQQNRQVELHQKHQLISHQSLKTGLIMEIRSLRSYSPIL